MRPLNQPLAADRYQWRLSYKIDDAVGPICKITESAGRVDVWRLMVMWVRNWITAEPDASSATLASDGHVVLAMHVAPAVVVEGKESRVTRASIYIVRKRMSLPSRCCTQPQTISFHVFFLPHSSLFSSFPNFSFLSSSFPSFPFPVSPYVK